MPLGFLLLAIGGGAAALAGLFAIAYGISMGLSSIVRGTVRSNSSVLLAIAI